MQTINATIITIALTAMSGIAVFVAGQVISRLVLEPAAQVRKALAEISSLVLYRQRQITNATPNMEISEDLRRASAHLLANTWMVPAYSVVRHARLWQLPTKSDVIEACRQLNLIAYGTMPGSAEPRRATENYEALVKIGRLLEIPVQYETPQVPPRKGSNGPGAPGVGA